jgi:hypothetical protein
MLPLAILGRSATPHLSLQIWRRQCYTGMSLSPGNHLLITATNLVVVKMTHVTMHKLVITFRGKLNDKNKATSIFFKPIALKNVHSLCATAHVTIFHCRHGSRGESIGTPLDPPLF